MPKPSGRTNAQATDQTTRALLDATLECIAEVGYARASTTEIARRAGVSHGAMVHHFPAKADLIAAATHHLFERGTTEFVRRFGDFDPADRTFDKAVDLLWTMFTEDSFRAGLALLTAAGTDPELQGVVHDAVETFREDVTRVATDLFPGAARQPFADTAVIFAFAVVLGSSLYRLVGLGEYADESLGVLRVLAQLQNPAAMPTAPRPE